MNRIDITIFYLLDKSIFYENLGKFVKHIGSINSDDTPNVIEVFRSENLKNLKQIDYYGYTIFNKLQIESIKNEIDKNNIKKAIPEYVITLITEAIKVVDQSEEDCYLIFEGE